MSSHDRLFGAALAIMLIVTSVFAIGAMSDESDAVTDLGSWKPSDDPNRSSPDAAYSGIANNVDKIYNSGARTLYLLQGGNVTLSEWGETKTFYIGSIPGGAGFVRTDNGDGTSIVHAENIQKLGSLRFLLSEDKDGQVNAWWLEIIVVGESVTIDSKGGTEATVGYEYEYNVQTTPSDAQISISGVDWLSVSGHTISGTPTEGGSFTLRITASHDGYESTTETVVIAVSEEQTSEGAPVINDLSYTIDPSNPYRVTFEVDAENASGITIDFGDGTSGSGSRVTHTYDSSGSYTVRAVATNANGSTSETESLLIADRTPNDSVQYNHQYTFTLGIETSGVEPVVSGCPFLDVTVGSNYVTVSGIPSSTAYVGQTYNVTLTVGQFTMSWSLTVTEGSTVPVAGFTVETDGLTVIVTSTATNADMTFYQWTAGGSFVQSNSGVTRYTYAEPGTYTITQRVTSTVDGQTITDEYHTTVEVSLSDPGPAPAESDPVPFVGLAMVAIGIIALAAGAYVRNYYVIALAAVVAVIGAILWYI